MKLSLNHKASLLVAALLLVLVVLVIKAVLIRQRKTIWLENLNREEAPLMGEDLDSIMREGSFISAPSPSLHATGVGASSTEPVAPTEAGDGFAELVRVSFPDYRPGKRAEAEAVLFEQFNALLDRCAQMEPQGGGSGALKRLEQFFSTCENLGASYHFQQTEQRERFAGGLRERSSRLPYMSHWAAVRMLGIAGGQTAVESLRGELGGGIFEDEAAIGLLKAGDTKALPVLLDYVSRGRIKSGRYNEVVDVLSRQAATSPAVVDALITFLDSGDSALRAAALDLLKKSLRPPEETLSASAVDDPGLARKWSDWWKRARASFRPPAEDRRDVVALSLITGIDTLSGAQREYFLKLQRDIEECCRALRSFDLEEHRGGEKMLYQLARRMVEDYGSAPARAQAVMEQCMGAMAGEVQTICLRQIFPSSEERSSFVAVAPRAMDNAPVPVLIFMSRLLGVAGERGALGALDRYRQSWVADVRRAAAIAMGLLGSAESLDDIAAIVAERGVNSQEGECCVVALERIGNKRAAELLLGVVRRAQPLLAYDAYLSLRALKGEGGRPVALEEFEQRRDAVADDLAR